MRASVAAVWVGILAAVTTGCGSTYGGPSASGPPASGFVITISGMAFSPLDLHVPPGQTVTVVNRDAMDHSVTSEASPSAFVRGTAGGVSFDTGPFTGSRSFTIPANAQPGAAVPYFCTVHAGTMATPNGTITIDPAAAATTAAPAPGGAPGY